MTINPPTLDFCHFYGINPSYFDGPDRYEVTGAPLSFDGRVQAIRVLRNGRFGNIVLQLLHAAMVARQFAIPAINAFAFEGGPDEPVVETPGLTFRFDATPADSGPALTGGFFNSYPFQSVLSGLHADFVNQTIDANIRPIFRHRLAACQGDACEAVLHFRSGDIFEDPPSSTWYVQPPAAFYLRAFANLQENFGVRRASLVFEDRRNPAVDAVEAALRQAGVGVALTDCTFAADLSALLGARHIISSFSTFTETAAMLSREVLSFSAFRSLESHTHLHGHRPRPLFQELLRSRGVRGFLLTDAAGDYIAPMEWQNTAAQRRVIVEYPASGLALSEPAALPAAADQVLLVNAMDEAITVRGALRLAHDALARMETKLAAADRRLTDNVQRLEQSENAAMSLRTERDAMAAELQDIRSLVFWRALSAARDTARRARRRWSATAPPRRHD